MKRVLSLILAISMIMSMFTFSFAGVSLSDVAGTEYQAAVEALVELGIVNGYEDGTYRPEQKVSRAEMAKLLVIAAGLEAAAEINEGATRFTDVNGGWASGYINVAAEYGYIMGDPDGSFRPDDTVSYAEAATMALRVLGYKSVVEAKGTWPTNYIAKAEDLDMLEDITYGNYSEGATRGNVAVLMWNMLRTDMWAVRGESDGDGLEYDDKQGAMLNIKFKDYRYFEADFDYFTINDDGEVMVGLLPIEDSEDAIKELLRGTSEYEYFGNDFYTFVPGTEVEVLVNTKDDTLLTMVRTGSDKLVEGIKEDIDEDYDEISGDLYLYAHALVERKAIVAATEISGESTYVYEINTTNKNYIKFNEGNKLNVTRFKYDDMETEIILKDGERATIEDVEVGDVLTQVKVVYRTVSGDVTSAPETFWMVGSTEVEGTLTKVVIENFENPSDKSFVTATISKEEYPVAPEARYVEDTDDMDEHAAFNASAWNQHKEKMNGEEVVAVLDVFGRITTVLFDGKIDAGEGTDKLNVKFVTITGAVDRDGDYTLPVEDIDGEDTLVFANKTEGNAMWKNDEDITGSFTIVTLNDDGEIEALKDASGENSKALMFSARNNSGEVENLASGDYWYGEEADEYYTVTTLKQATYNKDKKALVDGAKSGDVGANTIVVTLIHDDKGTNKPSDDEYYAKYSEGTADIEGLKGDLAVIIKDNATKLGAAKYVVIFDEVATGEDDLFGILADVSKNEIGEILLTVADVRITDSKDLKEAKKDAMILNTEDTSDGNIQSILSGDAGQSGSGEVLGLLYSTRVNKDDEVEITVHDVMVMAEFNLKSGDLFHAYVSGDDDGGEISDNGREAVVDHPVSGEIIVDLDETDDNVLGVDFEDYRFVIVNVELDAEDDAEAQYLIESFEEVAYEDITFKFYDRISLDETSEVILVIRGMSERPYVAPSNN